MKISFLAFLSMSFALVACQQGNESDSEKMMTDEGFFNGHRGVRLFYRMLGNAADTVIVLNGGPGCNMEYLIPDLEPLSNNHTVVYYDQLGSGRSELPADSSKLTIEQFVEDLEQLRKFLGLQKLTLIGHSFGALLANFYMRDYPERLERVILIGGLPPVQGDFNRRYAENLTANLSPEQQTQIQEFNRQMLSGPNPNEACRQLWQLALRPRFADPAKIVEMKGDLCVGTADAIVYGYGKTGAAVWASIGAWDLRTDLANFPAPVLLIHGEHEAIPMDMMEEWITVLPTARLLQVADAAHFPYIENPEVVWPAIENFLNGDWPNSPEVSSRSN